MDSVNTEDFADQVAELCYNKYSSLPKKGKPQANKEWTLVAAIVATHHLSIESKQFCSMEVVSLATGTKCLSESKLQPNGSALHDSHAEILVRRGFNRFLLAEIEQCVTQSSCYIESTINASGKRRFMWNPCIKLHLFTSHTPCGDASIFPKSSGDDAGLPSVKQKAETESEQHPKKRLKTEHADIHRTGAKCVPGGAQDCLEEGKGYHAVALLRTKPGRGERTLSMCCSDKMAKWNVLGIQGALLSVWLTTPIYLSSVIVGRCAYSDDAMNRALVGRISELESCQFSAPFQLNKPRLLQANKQDFEHSKFAVSASTDTPVACSAAVSWYVLGSSNELSVSVNGFKQGVTVKHTNKPSAWSPISKYKIMEEFIRISTLIPEKERPNNFKGNMSSFSYKSLKMSAESYQSTWQLAKSLAFQSWMSTPRELYDFTLTQ